MKFYTKYVLQGSLAQNRKGLIRRIDFVFVFFIKKTNLLTFPTSPFKPVLWRSEIKNEVIKLFQKYGNCNCAGAGET